MTKKLYKSIFVFLAVTISLSVNFGVSAQEKPSTENKPTEDKPLTEQDRFRLWNDCKPVGLLVDALPPGAAKIGLTYRAIEATVRNKLVAAKIYESESGVTPFLNVQIGVTRAGFLVNLNLKKTVLDPTTDLSSDAVTWYSGSTGTHGRHAPYVVEAIDRYTDAFVAAYLRVNEEECE